MTLYEMIDPQQYNWEASSLEWNKNQKKTLNEVHSSFYWFVRYFYLLTLFMLFPAKLDY